MNDQKKITSWWRKICFRSCLSRPVTGPTNAAGDAERQYWWLLPGDAAYAMPENAQLEGGVIQSPAVGSSNAV
ncbi:hypothetical protein [Pseudarthrobacter sp. NBSH8]|uniref:hypothetical protein n=1 Tax=Pseudarthrobacter sp. NBSH8 TaxID=2596911 RepID=UPI00162817A1|nr:hypothetical protein [Pseudarthrobacter sp. NBSH8]QNE13739.1 hypothetical protein FYJ92_04150 [Pseudarthrobacter sp. NBSH8]